MILGFKTEINGKPTQFVEKILKHLGSKAATKYFLHQPDWVTKMRDISYAVPKSLTIRDDKNFRWVEGQTIHFATGVRTKQYNCFATGKCTGTSELFIHFYEDFSFSMQDDGITLSHKEMEQLAKDDGFDSWEEFCAFHMPCKNGLPFYPPGGFLRKRIIYF